MADALVLTGGRDWSREASGFAVCVACCPLAIQSRLPVSQDAHGLSLLSHTMVSKLEDTLLRCSKGTGWIRAALFGNLEAKDLRRMRVVSRTLHDLVDHFPERLFDRLFVNAPLFEYAKLATLRSVAPFCRSLEIVVREPLTIQEEKNRWSLAINGWREVAQNFSRLDKSGSQRWKEVRAALKPKRPTIDCPESYGPLDTATDSTYHSSRQSSTRPRSDGSAQVSSQPTDSQPWMEIFSACHQLRCLTLRTHGDPAWPGRTFVEAELIALRIALEVSAPPHLNIVCLMPVHAMGIIHLRPSLFGAFGSSSIKSSNIWHIIDTLELQVNNPFVPARQLSEPQQVVFTKILHDYLRGFATTLKRLRFVWLDGEGPCPVALELEPGLDGQRAPIMWQALEEIWLGNTTLPHRTIRLLPERTTGSVRLKTLRSTHRLSRMSFDEPDAWMEVLLGERARQESEAERVVSRASSVYSQ